MVLWMDLNMTRNGHTSDSVVISCIPLFSNGFPFRHSLTTGMHGEINETTFNKISLYGHNKMLIPFCLI